jgi:hypothetical protein
MLNKENIKQIQMIWDEYDKSDKKVLDSKGNEISNIDESRKEAIEQLEVYFREFIDGITDIYEFKTKVDSFNKRNNLWGFTAIKGQMFFNQLVNINADSINNFSAKLKRLISEPENHKDALSKIEQLESSCREIYLKAKNKRKVPNPGSIGYFLSYFWQIHNHRNWPIMYTSQINAFRELDIWEDKEIQKETYDYFYKLNEEIKEILGKHTNKNISNWDIEHALWDFKGNPNTITLDKNPTPTTLKTKDTPIPINSSFKLSDYLIPRVANLVELGKQTDISSSQKGSQFEKLVGEIFKLLDFEVEMLGQGKGRNPDAIVKLREENTAFLIDAKAYSDGYSLGTDDRAIKEYIQHYCPKLQKEGYKKLGFIVVSNSFRSSFDGFINEITWNTDIKRFILLTSEALMYLLALKTKDRLNLSTIIENLIGLGNPVEAKEILEKFDDV